MNQNINSIKENIEKLKDTNINEEKMYSDFIISARLQSYLNYIDEKDINIFDKDNINSSNINRIRGYLEKNKMYFSNHEKQEIKALLIKLTINSKPDKKVS